MYFNVLILLDLSFQFEVKWIIIDVVIKYQSHYIQKHQNEVRINENTVVSRTGNGKYVCLCGKEFDLGQSLKRHYGNCIKAYEKELENEQGKIYSFYLFY